MRSRAAADGARLLVDDVEDLHHLSSSQVLDQLRELTVERNRLDAVLARLARHAELTQAVEVDGLVSVRSWLIGHLRLPGAEASRLVRVGRAVEHFPVLAAAFADGWVSAAQVDVMASAVGDSERAAAQLQGIDLGVFDRAWTQVATTSSHRALVVAVQAFVEALDPDGAEPDPVEQRALSISTHADGTVTGRFDLDAVGGRRSRRRWSRSCRPTVPRGTPAAGCSVRPTRCWPWPTGSWPPAGYRVLRSVKPHVVVTIGCPGPLAGLRRDGVRIVMGPDGTPLDVGRTHRVVTPGLRRAAVARDKGCVFAGCGAPHHWWKDPTAPHHSQARGGPLQPGRVRTAPRQGPPRFPRRARPRWTMAHPPPRRHRDHHRTPIA